MAGHDWNDVRAYYFGSPSPPGQPAPGSVRVSRSDERKFDAWKKNYDGTIEESGRLVKGAVEDFFGCRAIVGVDGVQVRPPGGDVCAHRRAISVTTSRTERPPSWAVQK